MRNGKKDREIGGMGTEEGRGRQRKKEERK